MAYISLAEAKSYLGIASADTSDDVLLTAHIAAAQSLINLYTGRVFEASALSERTYGAADVRGQVLHLDSDVLSISSVQDSAGAVLLGQLTLEPRNTPPYRALRLKAGRSWSPGPDDYIGVSGLWGYSATPPAAVVAVTKTIVHWLYHAPDLRIANKQGAQRIDMVPPDMLVPLYALRVFL